MVGEVLNAPPHLPWVIVVEMILNFPLVGGLSLLDTSLQVGSSSAVEGSVTRPEGGVPLIEENSDLLCHPGLLVWVHPDVFAFVSETCCVSMSVSSLSELPLAVSVLFFFCTKEKRFPKNLKTIR